MKGKIMLLLASVLILAPFAAAEQSCDIYFFFSPTCPHCAKAKPFIHEFEEKYPTLNINYVDVGKDYDYFKEVSEQYGSIPVGVPRIIIDGKVFVGFSEEDGELEYNQGYKAYTGYKNQIKQAILNHLSEVMDINVSEEAECSTEPTNPEKQEYLFVIPLVLLLLYAIFAVVFRKRVKKQFLVGAFLALIIVILFYISQHLPTRNVIAFAKQFSFPVFTIIIALLDGFNPCAFAVLAILLSLLIYAQSKKKMALIGLIFIITSGVMYYVFILVLLTLRAELLGGYKDIIRTAVGVIALIAGIINVKDFFFFKKGLSLTISSEKMGKLTAKMRKIVDEVKLAKTAKALSVAIVGTIILAVFVNLVELGCTLILPVQYIEVLITNFGSHVSSLHYGYIALYCLVYIVPLIFILISFLYTFKSERMTEGKGRVMKLIGGIIMLGLGLILLLKPELLTFV